MCFSPSHSRFSSLSLGFSFLSYASPRRRDTPRARLFWEFYFWKRQQRQKRFSSMLYNDALCSLYTRSKTTTKKRHADRPYTHTALTKARVFLLLRFWSWHTGKKRAAAAAKLAFNSLVSFAIESKPIDTCIWQTRERTCDETGADERSKKLPHVLSSRCFLPQHTYLCNKSKQITAAERHTEQPGTWSEMTHRRGRAAHGEKLSYLISPLERERYMPVVCLVR